MSEINNHGCNNCKYRNTISTEYQPVPTSRGESYVLNAHHCRRHSPTREGWPVIEWYHWCGDWEKQEES